jgi:hypothetical protein
MTSPSQSLFQLWKPVFTLSSPGLPIPLNGSPLFVTMADRQCKKPSITSTLATPSMCNDFFQYLLSLDGTIVDQDTNSITFNWCAWCSLGLLYLRTAQKELAGCGGEAVASRRLRRRGGFRRCACRRMGERRGTNSKARRGVISPPEDVKARQCDANEPQ